MNALTAEEIELRIKRNKEAALRKLAEKRSSASVYVESFSGGQADSASLDDADQNVFVNDIRCRLDERHAKADELPSIAAARKKASQVRKYQPLQNAKGIKPLKVN